MGEGKYKPEHLHLKSWIDSSGRKRWSKKWIGRLRAADANPKAKGTNPRAKGTNLKALGLNPRALGTNPNAKRVKP